MAERFDELEKNTLFVKKIPLGWNEWRILEIFMKFGKISNIVIPHQKIGNSWKYAFVKMIDKKGFVAVQNSLVDGKYIIDRTLTLEVRQARKDLKSGSFKTNLQCLNRKGGEVRVFVKNYANREISPQDVKIDLTDSATEIPLIKYDLNLLKHSELGLQQYVKVRLVPSIFDMHHGIFYAFAEEMEEKKWNELKELTSAASVVLQHNLKAVEVGDLVFVVLSKPGGSRNGSPNYCMLRSVVLKVGGEFVTVLHLDKGDFLFVKLSQLRPLPNEFCRTPFVASACALSGLARVEKKFYPELRSFICKATYKVSTKIRTTGFKGNVNLVQILFVENGNTYNLSELYVNRGLCTTSARVKPIISYSRDEIIKLNAGQKMDNSTFPEGVKRNDSP